MKKVRFTGRFYAIIAIIMLIIAIIAVRIIIARSAKQDVIIEYSTTFRANMNCVVIRDEEVTSSDATVRVEYIADESTFVNKGETVAYTYMAGYTENLLTKLEATRQNIQAYHKTLLGTIIDSNLDRLEEIVSITALDFKNMVTGTSQGNLKTVIEQMETAMVNRQEYLRQNKRDDTRLTKLYDEENARMTSIQSWRRSSDAERDGVISFYLDGYEEDLKPSELENITISNVRSVLNGQPLSATASILSSGIYRLVDQEKWYAAILVSESVWNPVIGQEYYLTFGGYEDLSFKGMTVNVMKQSGQILAFFEINEPIGPILYLRSGTVTLSTSLSSLAVHEEALYNLNGQIGIWLYDVPGGSFIPVNVLYTENGIALIEPLAGNSLQLGQIILIK